jgi:hypothetical protein
MNRLSNFFGQVSNGLMITYEIILLVNLALLYDLVFTQCHGNDLGCHVNEASAAPLLILSILNPWWIYVLYKKDYSIKYLQIALHVIGFLLFMLVAWVEFSDWLL